MELVIAFVVVSSIFLAGTGLMLSFGRTAQRLQTESQAQQDMVRLFQYVEDDLRDIKLDPTATTFNKPATLLCVGKPQTGSPCAYSGGGTSTLMFNRKSADETVQYTYSYQPAAGSFGHSFKRTVSVKVGPSTVQGLSSRLLPYADADLDLDGTVTATEVSAWDACLVKTVSGKKVSNLSDADCGSHVPPVSFAFRVSPLDQKIIQVSARTKLGKPGITKTMYVLKEGD